MLRNYLKIALRSLRKQRLLSLINVMGLSVGLACFSLFMLYAVNEFSFDRFHEKADRIYRVYRWSEAIAGNDPSGDASLPMPLGPAMQADLPDIEAFVRFRTPWGEELVRVDGQISRQRITYADPNVFDVFTFPVKYGDPATALSDPGHLVLTESAAGRFFGMDNPIGRPMEIQIDGVFEPFTVSAVIEDPPSNSTIEFGILGSYEKFRQSSSGQRSDGNWGRSAFATFVLLNAESTLPDDPARLLAFRERYYPDTESSLREQGFWTGEGPPVTYRLQALRDVHSETEVRGGFIDPVDPKNTWMLLAIAAGVLLIACINFTTLAIGRSAGRAKEVGVRKVVGSRRVQLIFQFFTEALLLCAVSAGLGLLIARWLLPSFNELSGRTLDFSMAQFPEMVWLFVLLIGIVGITAGSYPALVLSRLRPVEVLKSKVRIGGTNVLTKSLVTLQFVVAIGLIISTTVIMEQVRFMTNKNPGFEKENVVIVDAHGVDTERIYPLFRQALAGRPEVVGVASSELRMGEGGGWARTGWDYRGQRKDAYEYFVDEDYLDVLGLELIAGRNFDPTMATDTTSAVIVNEAFLKDFGWTLEDAVGQVLEGYSERVDPIVVGVVRDFNYRSFHETVDPQLFHMFADYAPFQFYVRIQPGNPSVALQRIGEAWERLAPELPFQYSFLDDNLDRFYRADATFGKIIGWAGGLSIFLSCLGLFGLATLAAANRTKEVGIRKVLGASYTNLVALLSRDFLRLVAISVLLAAPVAWYLMQAWLEGFAFRISISWWHIALAGGAAVVITFITVAAQSIRTVLSNPVDTLRYE